MIDLQMTKIEIILKISQPSNLKNSRQKKNRYLIQKELSLVTSYKEEKLKSGTINKLITQRHLSQECKNSRKNITKTHPLQEFPVKMPKNLYYSQMHVNIYAEFLEFYVNPRDMRSCWEQVDLEDSLQLKWLHSLQAISYSRQKLSKGII